MARLTIASQAPPATQGPVENMFQDFAKICGVACVGIASCNPGILAGATVAAGWRWLQQPTARSRIVCASLLFAALVPLQSLVVVGWTWRAWLANGFATQIAPVDGVSALRSFYAEALAGPLWFEAMMLVSVVGRRSVGGQVRHDDRLDRRRWRAISGKRQSMFATPAPFVETRRRSNGKSRKRGPGTIHLGIDAETNLPFDLELPTELATHTLLIGATGSGKTTTLATLADGAVANGHAAVIIDCKGGGLGDVARDLAARHHVPFQLVDPDDPSTLGYNPCSADAASVANKLVGAFTYSASAEIYKNIAMEAIPVVVRALRANHQVVTLDALYDAFAPRGIAKLAHAIEVSHLSERLLALSARNDDRLGKSGHAGLRHRLGALLEGRFGSLFRATTTLDWGRVLAEPSVTYIALSALASSEDVELMGRVIAQDLKQECARRLRTISSKKALIPALAIFDEFAALDEAEQLGDLLLQARQALMPTVISTQYLPESVPLRRAVLGAGLLIAHRVEGEDAEAIANQFGTRRATQVTQQVDYESGYSEKGSIRRTDAYNVHPNELRTFMTGQAGVKLAAKRRYSIVHVAQTPA
jgi:Type IV secretion-system coupling protein DNA-binding domain